MNILSKIKRLSRRSVVFGAVTAAVVGAGLFATSTVNAAASNDFNCDSNAVVYCGAETANGGASASEITSRYNNGDKHNSAASIQHIYSWFKISNSDIQNLDKTAQNGSVTKSGDVYIGNNLVATNALTAGREYITGSKEQTDKGTVFYTRPPKVSFLDNSLSAYVVMQNGQFKFAILESCGNPVTATAKKPTPKPSYTINKEVKVTGTSASNYAKSVNVDPGTHVTYRITVDSTGNSPVTNLKVSDNLPSDIQYISGSLDRDGKPVSTDSLFSGGTTISSLKNGTSTDYTFEAIVGPKVTVETCQAETLNNVGHITATSLPGESSTATVNEKCQPKTVYSCTSLNNTPVGGNEISFVAKAVANNGATISAYNFSFGDGTTKTVATTAGESTAQHTYSVAGTYKATVSVDINVDGGTKTVTSPACSTTVTIAQPPAAECTDLKLIQSTSNPLAVTATAVYKTKNGATLSGVSFDWGDGVTTPASLQTTADHTYQNSGTYTVVATLAFSAASGSVPNSNCQASITVKKAVTPKPCYTINKEVAIKGSDNYVKSISNVKPGTHVVYRITVASTGNAPVTNLDVNDTLPTDVQYVAGTLKRDNVAASTSFFSNGVTISSLANGTSTVFTFEAIVGPKETAQTCTNETLNNVGHMTATNLPAESSTATVKTVCQPKPVYSCTSLTPYQVSSDEFSFTAKAAASNGAVITGYNFNFGDGTAQSVTTAAGTTTVHHAYGTPGTYDAAVSAIIQVNGATKTVTSSGCSTSVTIAQPPAAECTDLKLIQSTSNPLAISATAEYTATNGATLSGVSFDWGDGVTTPASLQTTADHTYQNSGTYTVVATLSFSATSGSIPNSTCQAPVTITTVTPTCDELDISTDNASKTVTVTNLATTANGGTYEFTTLDWGDGSAQASAADVTGQTHTYTTDGPFTIVATAHFTVNGTDTGVTSAACQQPVSFTETPPATPPAATPPTQLVNTGAGNVVGIFAAATAIGIVGYRWILGRRLNRGN